MRPLFPLLAPLVLCACQMQLPVLGGGAPEPAEGAALAQLLSEATGADVPLDPAATGADEQPQMAQVETGQVETAQAQEAQALGDAFEQAAAPPEKPKGLFAFLKPKPAASPLEGSGVEVVNASAESSEAGNASVVADADAAPISNAVMAAQASPAPKKSGGLFAFLRAKDKGATPTPNAAREADPSASQEAVPADLVDPDTLLAEKDAAGPDVATPDATTPDATIQTAAVKPKRAGLFAGLLRPRANAAPAAPVSTSTVSPGEVLPFGQVGIACEAKPARAGKLVDKFPVDTAARWKVYDTDADSTAPRTHFITGFADGCPRQVTASLVLFGSAGMHEVHRYADDRKKAAWSDADNAYEVIKAKACGVKKKKPCPSDKIGGLDSRLAFVSVYQSFGGKETWLELLLDNGALVSEQLR